MSHRLVSLAVIVVAIFLAFFIYPISGGQRSEVRGQKSEVRGQMESWHWGVAGVKIPAPEFLKKFPFRLGLDLLGGTHLVYKADLSKIEKQSPGDAMAGVRDVIERRVNLFGVEEPLVQIEGQDRLVVELAGIKDVNLAIQLIGQTPFLEFREQLSKDEGDKIIKAALAGDTKGITAENLCDPVNLTAFSQFLIQFGRDPCYQSTGLTGSHLRDSRVTFDNTTYQPEVALNLNDEGTKLFAELTKNNLGKRLAIYLDGQPISAPTVQSEIPNGQAVITGRFSIQEAKDLVNRLNAGALPVPISLISQQTIGASLGYDSLQKSLKAGLYGLLAVAVFMLFYYRLAGLVSVFALLVYVALVLTVYKLFPVTLTLAGIAGFILSLGMAVDANILIFARMREELKSGKTLFQSVNEGFRRAWLSIRDSHVTTLLGAAVLYIFTTSFVRGFALTLGIGVLVSLFSAIVVTRSFLDVFISPWFERHKRMF